MINFLTALFVPVLAGVLLVYTSAFPVLIPLYICKWIVEYLNIALGSFV